MTDPVSSIAVTGERKSGVLFRLIRFALFCAFTGALAGGAAGVALVVAYSKDLPEFTSVDQYRPKLVSKVYSVDGRLIGEFYNERRIVVPYDRIPKRLIQAFMASEDKKFFDHNGIDYLGMANAVLQKVSGRREKLRGASTITQQLAKSILMSNEGFAAATERSVKRKVREAILAKRLEKNLNKEEILWLYLNQVYLGHGAYGVQAAAENYFRKDVYELSLAEMSLIAGLPQAPSRYSPFVKPTAARARQEYVLGRMKEEGYITQAEKDEALAQSVEKTVHARDDRFLDTAPYFTEHVRRYVADTYTNKTLLEDGLTIWTTLDLERQNYAETALMDGVREADKRQGYLGPVAQVDDAGAAKVLEVIEKEVLKGKPLEEGYPVLGVVTDVDGPKQVARVKVGTQLTGNLPLAGARWARTPKPTENWEFHKVDNIRTVVKKGDVILVQPWFSKPKFLKNAMGVADAARLLPDESAVTEKSPLFTLDQVPRVQGALISMNPHTGYVEAMIGGYSFEDSEFNRAFQACKQPGSAFKPIVYSAAIAREEYSPATMILDTPITLRDDAIGKSWKPQNYDVSFRGEVTCRDAVSESMNMPALHTMLKVGVKNVVDWAKHLGIKTALKEELGTALGSSCVTPWELASVYTTFARMGLRPEPVFIKRIIDRDGKVLEEHANPEDPWQGHSQKFDSLYRLLDDRPARAMDPVDTWQLHYLLTQVATRGTAARAHGTLQRPVAGKTGTTNDSFDAWFSGYTPSLVTTVWVGYDTYEYPLSVGEQGGRTALPIWLDYMVPALKGKVEQEWTQPAGICNVRVDNQSGRRIYAEKPQSFIAPVRCGKEPEGEAAGSSVNLDEAQRRGGI